VHTNNQQEHIPPSVKTVSRREFLKIAGVTGAALGMGTGLGGLLAACGDEETTTTTAGATSTTAASTTTTAAASTTTVSAGPEKGRDLKVGMVEPQTGPLAQHGIGVEWAVGRFERVLPDGIVCGDGKQRLIKVLKRDTQSDSNRAAQVTGDLIMQDKVDLILSGGAPDTYVPSAGTCEALGCPSLSNAGPWQALAYQSETPPAEGYHWTYGDFIGSEQSVACFIDMFSQVPNNMVVGILCKNDAEGMAWMGENAAPAVFEAMGYTLVEPSLYQPGTEDFSEQISAFKKGGCELVCGTNNAPDFTNFWKQSIQQGFNPVLCSTGNALLFPQTLDAIGDIGIGLLGEIGWHRSFPFKDYLTGDDANALADDFEATMNMQYGSGSTGSYTLLQWAVDVLKRATNPEDKESIVEAIRTTNMQTSSGPIDFTSPVDTNPVAPTSYHPAINCCKQPFAGGQWIKAITGKWTYDNLVCSVITALGCEVQAEVQPMAYE
jgi:branched-chain amino acid transport system substrate-binding protein